MNANEPAFPISEEKFTREHSDFNGLSKREYFAAKAMQALAPPFCEMTTDLHHERNEAERVARWAVIYADALIDALKPSDSEAQG